MLCLLCYVCEDSQTTAYMKHVNTSLSLTCKNATARLSFKTQLKD